MFVKNNIAVTDNIRPAAVSDIDCFRIGHLCLLQYHLPHEPELCFQRIVTLSPKDRWRYRIIHRLGETHSADTPRKLACNGRFSYAMNRSEERRVGKECRSR